MIDVKVIEYLNSVMDVPAYGMMPENMSGSFLVVGLLTSGFRDQISMATVDIYCYAETKAEAAELAQVVKREMLNMIVLPEVSSAKLGDLTSDIDKKFKLPRYEVIMNLWYYD